MKSIDEAIQYELETAKKYKCEYMFYSDPKNSNYDAGFNAKICKKLIERHNQIARWLEDYRRLLGQEYCDDAVSRQYLLDEYDRQHKGPPGGARKIIENAPSVQPKRPSGHWIPDDDPETNLMKRSKNSERNIRMSGSSAVIGIGRRERSRRKMFTLDEAITHCEETAKDKDNLASTLWDRRERERCRDCATEHRQLAGWLRELRRYRENDKHKKKLED